VVDLARVGGVKKPKTVRSQTVVVSAKDMRAKLRTFFKH
jgi:hypothetical protein